MNTNKALKAIKELLQKSKETGKGISAAESVFVHNPEVLERINKLVPRGLPFDEANKALEFSLRLFDELAHEYDLSAA